jgi:hypothetical protein
VAILGTLNALGEARQATSNSAQKRASGVFLILSSKCLTESSILDLPESTDSRALPRGFGLRLSAPGEPPTNPSGLKVVLVMF